MNMDNTQIQNNTIKKIGSRAEVFHGNALKTSGGLEKKDLVKNKHGYIVSKRKVALSRKSKTNPLMSHGYLAKRKSKKFGPAKEKPKENIMNKIYKFFE
jgi:hypothetical protein